jgi:hypothetical protein
MAKFSEPVYDYDSSVSQCTIMIVVPVSCPILQTDFGISLNSFIAPVSGV